MNIKQTTKGWYVADGDSHLATWIEETGKLDHDEFLPPLVCSHLKSGDTVIDVGAMYGDHTIAYSRIVGKTGMVIACEAGKLAFECLKSNVELFPYKNVFPIHTCVSEFYGNSVTHSENENLGASVCSDVAKVHLKEGETYLMTVTIDFLAKQAERKIDFIKLDIEGWEAKALVGASKTLLHDRPGLLIEINPGALMLQGDTPQDIFDILAFHDYEWKIAQPECTVDSHQFDLLCFPKEKEIK